MGPSNVVYVEKRRGPRTDPWGTPESWCALDSSPPHTTLKDLPVRCWICFYVRWELAALASTAMINSHSHWNGLIISYYMSENWNICSFVSYWNTTLFLTMQDFYIYIYIYKYWIFTHEVNMLFNALNIAHEVHMLLFNALNNVDYYTMCLQVSQTG